MGRRMFKVLLSGIERSGYAHISVTHTNKVLIHVHICFDAQGEPENRTCIRCFLVTHHPRTTKNRVHISKRSAKNDSATQAG